MKINKKKIMIVLIGVFVLYFAGVGLIIETLHGLDSFTMKWAEIRGLDLKTQKTLIVPVIQKSTVSSEIDNAIKSNLSK
jgi:hypothetical protein